MTRLHHPARPAGCSATIAGVDGGSAAARIHVVVRDAGRAGDAKPRGQSVQPILAPENPVAHAPIAPAKPLSLKIRPIENREVAQGEGLQFIIPVDASPELEGKLVFSLSSGSPAGSRIDPRSGMFTWAPSAGQEPGKYPIVVEVSADNVRDTKAFYVNIPKVNHRPVIQPVESQTVAQGKTLTVPIQATDPDGDHLRFSMLEALRGAAIDPNTGEFTWTPDVEQAGTNYSVAVRVTDDGPGALSVEQVFAVHVAAEKPPEAKPMSALRIPRGRTTEFSLTFPSGKSLQSAEFAIQPEVKNKAREMLASFLSMQFGVVVLFSDESRSSISALCSCDVANRRPEGATVALHEGDDPATRYLARFRERSLPTPISVGRRGDRVGDMGHPNRVDPDVGARVVPTPAAMSAGPFHARAPDLSFWDDVVPKLYVTYNQAGGGKAGWPLGTPQARSISGASMTGRAAGLLLPLPAGRLTIVLECDRGEVQAVHLISAGEVEKTFADLEQASQDSTADAALKELADIESKLQERGGLQEERTAGDQRTHEIYQRAEAGADRQSGATREDKRSRSRTSRSADFFDFLRGRR